MSLQEKNITTYKLSPEQAAALKISADGEDGVTVPAEAWPTVIAKAAYAHDRLQEIALEKRGVALVATRLEAGVAQSALLAIVNQAYAATEAGYGPQLGPAYADQAEAFALARDNQSRRIELPTLESPRVYKMTARAAGLLLEVSQGVPGDPNHVPLHEFFELDQEGSMLGQALDSVS